MPVAIILLAPLFFGACDGCTSHHISDIIPPEPDYSDPQMWYVSDRLAGVDVFYITSTETDDYTHNNCPMHYADVTFDSVRTLIESEMSGVDHLLAGDLNYYSPYYRQCTFETFVDSALIAERTPLAMADVKRAFDHWNKNLSGGRPFILAGFSQGGLAVVELLKTMDSATCSRLVAAYVIGWKLSSDELVASTCLQPAADSADLHVAVCYNSVRTPADSLQLLACGNRVAINPVNWTTASDTALLPIPSGDTLQVHLDPESRLLIVEGYNGTGHELPLIGTPGNYHCLEILFYANSLKRNMTLRSQKMLEQIAKSHSTCH